MSPSRRRAVARGGSPPRCVAWYPTLAHRPWWLPVRSPGAIPLSPAITHAHYPCGAMGTSRPTAITPVQFAPHSTRPRPLAARSTLALRCALPWAGPVAVGRDVPIAPPRHMARCAAWHPALRLAPPRRCPWRLATAVRGLASSTR